MDRLQEILKTFSPDTIFSNFDNERLNKSRLKSALQVVIGGHIFAAGIATYRGHDGWYKNVVMPLIHRTLDSELVHNLAIRAAHYGIVPRMKLTDHPELKSHLWGLDFSNPVGLAAGFDKQGEAVDGLLKLGFGFVEIGSVTPEPQEGNPKPRIFRLLEDKAVINRYGFNSEGHKSVYTRLKVRAEERWGPEVPDDRNMLNENLWSPDRPKFRGRLHKAPGLLGVNLGKNKTSLDAASDYVEGVKQFGQLADYLVINISSPNTPGLRSLQNKEELQKLIDKVLEARNKLPGTKRPPLLIKLSPDLTTEDKADIAKVLSRPGARVDGLIISNTTISRLASLKSRQKDETGGLSGEPLKELSTSVIKDMYSLTGGKIPIIGVGGISSGKDAYEKIRAGASLIQIYSSLVYEGPPVVPRIMNELSDLLKKDGFSNISEAVGVDVRKSTG